MEHCSLELHSEIFPGPWMDWDMEVSIFKVQTVNPAAILERGQDICGMSILNLGILTKLLRRLQTLFGFGTRKKS